MAVSTDPSTFEFTRDWLVSSEAFVRDAMGIEELVSLDESRVAAAERIYREEALDEPNEEVEGQHAPDEPPPVCAPPRAIVITREDRRRRVGTGTWAGSGQVLVAIEVLVPVAYRVTAADTPAQRAEKFQNRRAWGWRLVNTIRDELSETSGRGHADGTPYPNATDINVHLPPVDPEPGEPADLLAWIYEIEWQ